MGVCVLEGCERECVGKNDICETCRGNICVKTRDKSSAQVDSDLTQQDKKYKTYMARNAIARDTSPGSYMEKLTTWRRLRKQQEQLRAKQRHKRRA